MLFQWPKRGLLFFNPSYRICSHTGQVVNQKGVNIKWLRLWDWRPKCRNSSWEVVKQPFFAWCHMIPWQKLQTTMEIQSSWVDLWWFIVGILSQMQFRSAAFRNLLVSCVQQMPPNPYASALVRWHQPGRVAGWSGMVLPNWNHLSKLY